MYLWWTVQSSSESKTAGGKSMTQQTPTFLTIKSFSEKHPVFTEASLRWLRFGSNGFRCKRGGRLKEYAPNGFKGAFKTIGRRILVDEGAFFEAIERQNAGAADGG